MFYKTINYIRSEGTVFPLNYYHRCLTVMTTYLFMFTA